MESSDESKAKEMTACTAMQTVGEKKLGKSTIRIIAWKDGEIKQWNHMSKRNGSLRKRTAAPLNVSGAAG